jgi:hypothetical protein
MGVQNGWPKWVAKKFEKSSKKSSNKSSKKVQKKFKKKFEKKLKKKFEKNYKLLEGREEGRGVVGRVENCHSKPDGPIKCPIVIGQPSPLHELLFAVSVMSAIF